MGSGLSSLMLCTVGLALGELLLCILTLSRAAALGLGLSHGWDGLHCSLRGPKGFLSRGRAKPNTGAVVPEPQPTQLPVPTLPRDSTYCPLSPQGPPRRV